MEGIRPPVPARQSMGKAVNISRLLMRLPADNTPPSAFIKQRPVLFSLYFFRCCAKVVQGQSRHGRNRSHLRVLPHLIDRFLQHMAVHIRNQNQCIVKFQEVFPVQPLLILQQFFPAQLPEFFQRTASCNPDKILPDSFFFLQSRRIQQVILTADAALKNRLCNQPLCQRTGDQHLRTHTPR